MLANGRAAAQGGDAAAAERFAQREGELVDAIHDEALRMTGIVTNSCSTWRGCRPAACS